MGVRKKSSAAESGPRRIRRRRGSAMRRRISSRASMETISEADVAPGDDTTSIPVDSANYNINCNNNANAGIYIYTLFFYFALLFLTNIYIYIISCFLTLLRLVDYIMTIMMIGDGDVASIDSHIKIVSN